MALPLSHRFLPAAAAAFALAAVTAGACASVATAPAAAEPAPKADVATFADLKTPLPYPYDEAGDADAKAVSAKIDRARTQARREHKLLLIDLGGNWCPDCRILAGTMELPSLKAYVERHYVEVTVDIGRHMEKNLQVPARYGLPKLSGVPSVLIVDPRTDRLLDEGHVPALADARHMSPQALADWLAQWPAQAAQAHAAR